MLACAVLFIAARSCRSGMPAAMPSGARPCHHALHAGRWEAAHAMRNRVLEFVREAAGAATLLDIRRQA